MGRPALGAAGRCELPWQVFVQLAVKASVTLDYIREFWLIKNFVTASPELWR
jgi:hypothetical protein